MQTEQQRFTTWRGWRARPVWSMWLHSSFCSERAVKGEALPPASVSGRFAGLVACAIACRLHRDDG